MVTKKKSTVSKKRTSVVKSHVKKPTKRTEVVYKSFKVAADHPAFFQPRLTRQTVYWSILLLAIIIAEMVIIATNLNAVLVLDALNAQ